MQRLATLAVLLIGTASSHGIIISLDFSQDTNNFFAGNPTASAALQAAATDLGNAITTQLSAISDTGSPNRDAISGTNGPSTITANWSYSYTHPSSGTQQTLGSTTLAANTVRIYVGSRVLGGSTLGQGGPGGAGVSVGGSGTEGTFTTAVNNMQTASNAYMLRGGGPAFGQLSGSLTLGSTTAPYTVSYGAAVGNLWFDNDTNNDSSIDSAAELANYWHFDHTTAVEAGKLDLYSVALHELLHSLGIGTIDAWTGNVSGTNWTGANVIDLYGTVLNLVDAGGGHIAENVMSTRLIDGTLQEVVMDPNITAGTRKTLTELDLAFLRDIGWQTIPEPSVAIFGAMGALALLRRRRND